MTTVFSASLLFMTMLASGSDDSGKAIASAQESTSGLQAGSAQSDADRIRQRVKEGQKVRITDDQGREWHGRIDALTPDNLTVVTHDRQRTDLAYGTILRIDRPHDSLANGALIGLASGAAFGLGLVIAEEVDDCEPEGFFDCGDPTLAAYFFAPLVTGGLGAAVGVGIDALIKKDTNLFLRTGGARVRLAPAVGPGLRAVMVSVRVVAERIAPYPVLAYQDDFQGIWVSDRRGA